MPPAFEDGQQEGALRKSARRALAGARKLLVVLVMLLALVLSPFALPVTLVVKWVQRVTGKTEQVTRRQ